MPLIHRTLLPSERALYTAHLRRLSESDRLMRFEAITSDAHIDAYVAGIADENSILVGGLDGAGEVRAAAHVALDGRLAELGLSVEQEFRGRGVGAQLVDQAIAMARLMGARDFTALCLARNGWMARELSRRGFMLSRQGATTVACRDLDPASPILLAAAFTVNGLGWAASIGSAAFGMIQAMLPTNGREPGLPAA